jgi:hypothetical protein
MFSRGISGGLGFFRRGDKDLGERDGHRLGENLAGLDAL